MGERESELFNIDDRGKFVVVYASNNLGKSVQIERIVARLNTMGEQVMRVKYPIYGLKPTGHRINEALRGGISMPEDVLQQFFADNRRDFQPTLINVLNAGVNVVAEDYTGTGIAWGMTRGIPQEELFVYNKGLVVPDAAILLDGERFSAAIEDGHRNEADGNGVWDKNRAIHLQLAQELGWTVVSANGEIEEIRENIWQEVGYLFVEP